MNNKTPLRITAKSIRKTLDMQSKSFRAVELIKNLPEYLVAENVLLYYPLKTEINLLNLLADNKKFYLPKVYKDNLLICPFVNGDNLEKSSMNIYEPCSNPVNPEILDIIFVPALMADNDGYRLGYGGGFYDKFLAKYPEKFTVLPIAEELCVEKLPREDFDIKVEKVLII